jgi:hypothetical protein
MDRMIFLLKVAGRFWPVLVIIVLVATHISILHNFPADIKGINRLVSLVSQLIGGLFVLYSIDSNLFLFRGRRLHQTFGDVIREVRRFGKSVTIQVQGLSTSSSIGSATVTTVVLPTTLDERVDYLERKISEMEKDAFKKSAEIHQKIADHKNDIEARISSLSTSVEALQNKMLEATVGGFKSQLFGVLLLVYGAISGYYS